MRFRSALASRLVLIVALLGAGMPAWAQDSSGLSDRLDRLERDLSTLELQVYKGRAAPAAAPSAASPATPAATTYSNLDDRITAIENSLTNLTDQIERANFTAGQLQSKLDRMQADNEFRFKALEERTAGLTPPPPADVAAPVPVPGADAPAKPNGAVTGVLGHPGPEAASAAQPSAKAPPATQTPQELYQYAWGLLRNNDYDGAKPAFQAFLAQNPKDPLAGNAAFWLGRIFFIEEDYEKAAVIFFDAYQKYPKSAKAGESLLNVGLSMGNLGKKKEACAALHRFTTEFSDAPDDLRRQAAAEKHKQGCN